MFGFVKRNTFLLKDPFALQSLHFTDPASPYASQCSLLHTFSLKYRRAIAGLLFLNDLLVGNISFPINRLSLPVRMH